ncbi:MAG: fasciclin domain-containing protein [Chloroflexi bacterium]|nr:fasciclin domain-containing protein [Chloroflexota bacterium]
MRRTRLIVILSILIALVLGGGTALAGSPDARAPQRLLPMAKVADTLPGSAAGQFHYYSIPYPGNGNVVTIRMVFTPGDPVMQQLAGFNVYGLNGYLIGSGIISGEGETKATARVLKYADTTPANWLVQVYNYSPAHAIDYTLVFEGLPAPAATPIPSATIVPGEDLVSVLARDGRYSTLVAAIGTAGLTNFLRTPGPYTLLAPTNAAFAALPAATWRALQADPSRLADLLRGHLISGRVPRATLRSLSAITTLAGTSLPLGVEGTALRVDGALSASGDVPAANGLIHSLDRVLLEVGGGTQHSGALAGSRGGAFDEVHLLLRPGAEAQVTLRVTGSPPGDHRAVGLNVYGPQGSVAAISAESDPYVMQVTFVAQDAGVYLLQVYNYDPSYTLVYTLAWR